MQVNETLDRRLYEYKSRSYPDLKKKKRNNKWQKQHLLREGAVASVLV